MDYASSPSFSSSSYPDQILPDCQKTSSVVYVLDFDLMNHFASLKLLCNSLSRPFCLNLSLFRFEVISVFWNLYAHTHVDACHHNTLTLWAEIHKQDPAFLRYFWSLEKHKSAEPIILQRLSFTGQQCSVACVCMLKVTWLHLISQPKQAKISIVYGTTSRLEQRTPPRSRRRRRTFQGLWARRKQPKSTQTPPRPQYLARDYGTNGDADGLCWSTLQHADHSPTI